jgi:hypothetical protein
MKLRRTMVMKYSLLLWASCLVCHLAVYFYLWSQAPLDTDVYVNTVGFQLIVFTPIRLPYWLAGLIVLLSIEFLLVPPK